MKETIMLFHIEDSPQAVRHPPGAAASEAPGESNLPGGILPAGGVSGRRP